ncbi:MAG TPA: 3D domain-containing protein [bacterium]|nr:3D domain-containing protein [bacterium]
MKKTVFLLSLLLFLFGFFPFVIFAQDTKLPTFTPPNLKVSIPGLQGFEKVTCQEGNICNIPWLGQYIAGLQRYAIGIVGIIAVIVLMLGGIIWLTAAGNPHQIDEAKKMIAGSLIGLFLVFGSYSILYLVNPNLTVMKNLQIGYINKIDLDELLAEITSSETLSSTNAARLNSLDKEGIIQHPAGYNKDSYTKLSCNKTLFAGGKSLEFGTTGYIKVIPWANTTKFFCAVGLNCTCPKGHTSDTACNTGKNIKCNYFDVSTPYCNRNAAGKEPKAGDVAADLSCFSKGDQICLTGPRGKKTLTINDTGSAIKGRRLDIFTGNDYQAACTSTGIVNVTLGPCN